MACWTNSYDFNQNREIENENRGVCHTDPTVVLQVVKNLEEVILLKMTSFRENIGE